MKTLKIKRKKSALGNKEILLPFSYLCENSIIRKHCGNIYALYCTSLPIETPKHWGIYLI